MPGVSDLYVINLNRVYDPEIGAYVPMTQPGSGDVTIGSVDQGDAGVDPWLVALPTGASTSAKQDTGNTSLGSIDGKLPALSGGRIPVVLPAGGSGLTDAELRADPVDVAVVSMTGGGLTDTELRAAPVEVDGSGFTQPVSGTFWQATQPVSGTFWQATQPVSGTVTANVSDNATRDNGKIDIASLDQYTPVSGRLPVDGSGVTQPVSGTFWQATQPVSGTFWQATQPVSGTFWQATQPVSIAATVAAKEVRSATGTQSTVADTASSTTLLASNANRLGATIANDSSAVLYVKLGATASATSYTARVVQYGLYELPYGYTGVVDGIWATDPGDGAARITEFT